jgi:plastocyanin
VRPRRRYLPLVAVLGAATAVLPAIAASAGEPTITGLETNTWSPSEVTVTPAGTVIFKNPSKKDEHDVVWDTGPETPHCEGVPSTRAAKWEGSCSFAKEGTYTFHCSVHGPSMSGVVVVSSTGTTTTTTTTTPTGPTGTTTTTPTGPSPGGGGGGGNPTAPGSSPPPGQSSGGLLSTLAGSAAHVSSSQHGTAVHGSVTVVNGGSELTVEVFAAAARLAAAPPHRVRVGRLARTGLGPGRVVFSVHLSHRALRTLHRRGRLALLVRISLTAPGGVPAHRSMSVVLHAH